MEELSEKLCANKAECLELADMIERVGHYREKAARLYHRCGRDDKYVSYLEKNLGKRSKEYAALITYYRENGKKGGGLPGGAAWAGKVQGRPDGLFYLSALKRKGNGWPGAVSETLCQRKKEEACGHSAHKRGHKSAKFPNHLQNTKSHLK